MGVRGFQALSSAEARAERGEGWGPAAQFLHLQDREPMDWGGRASSLSGQASRAPRCDLTLNIQVRPMGSSSWATVEPLFASSFSFEASVGPWALSAWSCGHLWGPEGKKRVAFIAVTRGEMQWGRQSLASPSAETCPTLLCLLSVDVGQGGRDTGAQWALRRQRGTQARHVFLSFARF